MALTAECSVETPLGLSPRSGLFWRMSFSIQFVWLTAVATASRQDILLPSPSSAFVIENAKSKGPQGRYTRRCTRVRRLSLVSPEQRNYLSPMTLMVTPNELDDSPTERWLDLRNTAVVPRMALSRLITPGGDTVRVDRVLVSDDDAVRALQFWERGDPDIVCARERDGMLCDANNRSLQYGMTFAVGKQLSYANPTRAIEVASSGGWVLIDYEDERECDESRDEAVSSLVYLLIGAVPSIGGDSLFHLGTGPFLGETHHSEIDKEQFSNHGKAGAAISCRTKGDIVKVAAMLQLLQPGGVVATESGILLRDGGDGPGNDKGDYTALALSSALVLPFDPSLWEIASYVLR